MNSLVIDQVEKTWISLPLKTRHKRHLTREYHDWTVFEIIRLRTNSELVGYGETMIYYTWGHVPEEQIERVIGRSPFEFLWDDDLGAGLQMAIYDLAGKALGLPAYHLIGQKRRDWCPISWWSIDMSTQDWCDEVQEALDLGYVSAKLKARPWRDLAVQMEILAEVVPSGFHFDVDFNGLLHDVGTAVPYLLKLERNPAMAIFETPIPHEDVEGYKILRGKVHLPVAMHYSIPPVQTVIREELCDGFIVNRGVAINRQWANVAAEMHKPFWLQMVGTGLMTAFMLHLGATLAQAVWPAITCHEIYAEDLLEERLEVRDGFIRVPEGPGLGVEVNEEVIARYEVEEGYVPPPPRNLYRVVWPTGASVVYPVGLAGVFEDFAAGNQPLFHPGVRLEIVPDDGSPEWEELHQRALQAPVRE